MGDASKYSLSVDDVQQAADELDVELAALRSVLSVESAGDGFLPDGRPKILFEAHIFSKRTSHKYDSSHAHISSRKWDRKLYGAPGAHQWDRLNEAILLQREAALMSASWGAAQIMGFNYKACGFESVEAFVVAMMESAAGQMKAFVKFIESQNLIGYLKEKDWAGFAAIYNGPAFAKNKYDEKLAAAYKRYSR